MTTLTQAIQSIIPSFHQSVVADQKEYTVTKDQFITFRDAFKELAHAKKVKASDIVLYNAVRGLPTSNGFTNITNPVKLANGQQADEGFKNALSSARFHVSRRPAEVSQKFNNFMGKDETSIKNTAISLSKYLLK